jgi:hypothetical protein
MTIHRTPSAPSSQLPPERRGPAVGRVCRRCGNVYSRFAPSHSGKPVQGKDHVDSPCSYEGQSFDARGDWWEPAVKVLDAPATEP